MLCGPIELFSIKTRFSHDQMHQSVIKLFVMSINRDEGRFSSGVSHSDVLCVGTGLPTFCETECGEDRNHVGWR